MKKIISLSAILLCCTVFIQAQSIERSVISSFGMSYAGPSLQADMTVGEVVTFTGTGSGVIITQGFHQPVMVGGTCLGDFDSNGVVGLPDLLVFISGYGCQSACGITDLDNNGTVGVSDLLIFSSVYGSVCP
jgi:hypothetical protein